MKRLFAFAPGLLLAAMTAVSVTADESLNYSISDDVYIEPVSMLGDAPTPGQKVDTCDCDVKGSKGGKGGCSCYLFGPDEAYSLYSGDNSLGISVGGWTQFGYTNRDSYADLFNQNSDKLNLHQQWFWAERVADGSCGWDWGFRADILYGIDANNTQAFGNDPGNWDYLNGFDHCRGVCRIRAHSWCGP